jgi:putative SOS response-associated peptidase YedK
VCGRFTLTVHHLGELAEIVGAVMAPELEALYRPRYNIAPSDAHFIVRFKDGQREIKPAFWGLINHWATDPSVAFKQINARAESLQERPAFRDAFLRRRCVLLADGFYEWRGPRGAREPLWYHPPDGSLMLMAGLYDNWRDPASGEWKRTFTIITTAANELVRPVHDRMPAILALQDVGEWLEGENPKALLRPAPEEALVGQPASPRVNSVENDDPGCLDPNDPVVKKQLSLF